MPTETGQDLPIAPPPGHRLTGRQIEAIYAVMRLLRDDTAASLDAEHIRCAACHRLRPAQGKVLYGDRTLCNGCATDYELLRTARSVRDVDDFLHSTRVGSTRVGVENIVEGVSE